MTTIAWDGKVLAADRMRSVGSTPCPATKVFRLDPPRAVSKVKDAVLFGCCGDSWDATAFRLWVDGGEKPAPKSLAVLVIDAGGRIWYGIESLVFHDIDRPFWATGSGADYALGAMAAGKSAREAVQIASDLDLNTGMGVDVLELVP